MDGCAGFDREAYAEHYGMSDEEQKTSAYGLAMDALVERLQQFGAFAPLRQSRAFYATRVEHDY
ncbi:MAG: hypothetical protein U0793_11710 [Gemmataceae bacterium]